MAESTPAQLHRFPILIPKYVYQWRPLNFELLPKPSLQTTFQFSATSYGEVNREFTKQTHKKAAQRQAFFSRQKTQKISSKN